MNIYIIYIVFFIILLLSLNVILNPSRYKTKVRANIRGFVCDKILGICTLTVSYNYNGRNYTVEDVNSFNFYQNRKIGSNSNIDIYIDPSNPGEISLKSRDNIDKGLFFGIIIIILLSTLYFYLHSKTDNSFVSFKT